jgi:hypothetical protein
LNLLSLAEIFKQGMPAPINFLPTIVLVKPLDNGRQGIYVSDLISKTHLYEEAQTTETLQFLEACELKNVSGVFNYYVGRGKQIVYTQDGFSQDVSVIQDIHKTEKLNNTPSTLEINRVAGELFEFICDIMFPTRIVI